MSEEFNYEVGDEFEGSPVEVTRFMHRVFAAGGRVEVDGDSLRIIELPEKPKEAEKDVPKAKEVAPKAKEVTKDAPKPKEAAKPASAAPAPQSKAEVKTPAKD